jgi:putative transposase
MELRAWLTKLGVQLIYSRSGKSWHNASSESFNCTIWRGFLGRDEFETMTEIRLLIKKCRRTYHEIRPHSRLGYRVPTSACFLGPQKAACHGDV